MSVRKYWPNLKILKIKVSHQLTVEQNEAKSQNYLLLAVISCRFFLSQFIANLDIRVRVKKKRINELKGE